MIAHWSSLCLLIFVLPLLSHAWISRPRMYHHTTFSRHMSRSTSCLYMGLRGKRARREKRRAMQEPTPPLIQTPYGPIRPSKPAFRPCDCCRGRGLLRCNVCEGRGVVRATGNTRRNRILVDKLVKSQWTSVEVYNGHRHHTIMEIRGSKKNNNLQVRMRNCCGEQQDFWISVDELRDKTMWRMGWLTLEQILQANGGALIDARLCFRCKGDRILPCVDCDGLGQIRNFEPLYD